MFVRSYFIKGIIIIKAIAIRIYIRTLIIYYLLLITYEQFDFLS